MLVSTTDNVAGHRTVDGYFGVVKRGMKDVYQHCSEDDLHRYLAEFEFLYNNREALDCNDAHRSTRAMGEIIGKQLLYRDSSAWPTFQ